MPLVIIYAIYTCDTEVFFQKREVEKDSIQEALNDYGRLRNKEEREQYISARAETPDIARTPKPVLREILTSTVDWFLSPAAEKISVSQFTYTCRANPR